MTIATAITAAQGRVADCYTAISNKGGTLPATQDLANMPTAINSISTGGSKYGCAVDNLLGDVDANGVLQFPANTSGDIVFTGVKKTSNYCLYCKFSNNYNITHGVSFPDLEEVNGSYAMANCFEYTGITSFSAPKLKTVSGSYGMSRMCRAAKITSMSLPELTTANAVYAMQGLCNDCTLLTSFSAPKLNTANGNYSLYNLMQATKITSFSLPELTEAVGNYSLAYICYNCSILETVYLPKLYNISLLSTFSYAFSGCPKLTDVYFNALTTSSFGSYVNQFNNMFNSSTASTSGNVNIHFPSNLQSTISGLTGYPNFGATAGRVTLLFDLPATN